MADISDSEGLAAWLNGKSPELACVPAARAALRAAPVLGWGLHEEEEHRRRSVVLTSFRTLVARWRVSLLSTQNGEAKVAMLDIDSHEQTQKTAAALEILVLGSPRVVVNRVQSAADVVARIREWRKED